jgi:HTH-type transcriptional repressor of NAD biosynthesis genes
MELDSRTPVLSATSKLMNGKILLCFYGPESTGKTIMAKRMAEIFNTTFVPEVARELITSNSFTTDDIINIGRAQTDRILEKIPFANRILFCDTDLITTQIYAQQYLGEVPKTLVELEQQIRYDHYFLFDIDVPWVADGMRDLGDKRDEMYGVFKSALLKRKIPFTVVKGTYEEREDFLKAKIRKILDAQI